MRPSSQHSPGLDHKVNGQIDSILREWRKVFAAPKKSDSGKGKKRGV